ncbi:MAG: TolC family protein [Bacteroidota bacterium]
MLKINILLLLISTSSLLFSQESLSLSGAISKSLAQNYDIKIERRNVEVAKVNNTWGEAGLFPNLSTQIQGSQNTFDNREALNPFSIIGKTKTTQIVPSLNLTWNLLNINNVRITKRRLEALENESEGNASIVVANTVQSVILGYYIALLEKERLAELGEQVELSRNKYELVLNRKEIGVAVTSELLIEEGNYLTDSINFLNQKLIYANALSNLAFLLGDDATDPRYELTDELVPDYSELDFQELLGRLNGSNIDLRTQYLTQAVLGYDKVLRAGERHPQLTLGANYDFTRNEQDISDWPSDIRGQLPETGNNENITYGVNFTLSFTLFNGGRINRAIQEAKIQEDIGNVRIERLKASLARDLKQAYDQYNIRRNLYLINERRFASSKRSLGISKDKFESGTIDSFDYRTVQNNNLTAAISRLQSIYDLIDSQITIMRLTGGIIETYNR